MTEPKPSKQSVTRAADAVIKDVMDAKAARDTIAADRQRRATMCLEEVQRSLQKYRCKLVAQLAISEDGRILARPAIVADQE